PLRPAMHGQSGSTAAHRRCDFLRPAEDPQRLGQPPARAGPGAQRPIQPKPRRIALTTSNTAIVTGGSAGIGAEIVRQMLDAGYEGISMARRAPEIKHERLHSVLVDLLDAQATGQAAAE